MAKKKENNKINIIQETINRMKENNINFYDRFSFMDSYELEKTELYNCTVSYKFNNYHSESCYFEIYAFNHDTKKEINCGTIYTKDTLLHPEIKTNFYYTEEAAKDLFQFMRYFDNILNDIYFNKL